MAHLYTGWLVTTVRITKQNETFMHIDTDPSTMYELSDFFTFEVPGARFSPSFKAKYWDGKIRLVNIMTGDLYLGLLPHVKEFCASREYDVFDQCPKGGEIVSLPDLQDFLRGLNLHAHGEQIQARDYQIDAVVRALTQARTLLLAPTASGKSLIIYILLRWYQERGLKQLIIVPTTALVEQMYTDFADYASQTDWDVDEYCTKVYAGQEKRDTLVTISTWQSLARMPKAYLQQFDVIYGDEAHLYQAKSLTKILAQATNTAIRIGTTGTLDGTKCNRWILEGLFGSVYDVTTTKKLMDADQLASLDIKCLSLQYSDIERKACAKLTYQEEIDFLVSHPRRNAFVTNLAVEQKGNTLLLFQYIEKHGKLLYDLLIDAIQGKRMVFFVHGGVDAEQREQVRAITEQQTDAIIVASVGVFSQGTNIRNLHNIILASPTKSRIRNLQSIGRGLRKSDTKMVCNLYDIGDDLSWKSHKNYTLLHLIERIKIYNGEGFEYRLYPITLTGNHPND